MLITSADLKTQTKGDLAQMAKRLGVSAWNTLSKEQLVTAIVKQKKSTEGTRKASKSPATKSATAKPSQASTSKPGTKAGQSAASKTKKAAAPTNRVAAKANSSPGKSTASKSSTGKSVASKSLAAKSDGKQSDTKKGTKSSLSATQASSAKKTASKTAAAKSNKSVGDKPLAKTNGSANHLSKANGSVTSKSDTKVKSKAVASKPATAKPEALASTAKPGAGKSDAAADSTAIASASKPAAKKTTMVAKKVAAPKKPTKPALPPTNPEVLQRIRELQEQRESVKDLAREFEEQPIRIEAPKPEPTKPEPGEDGHQKDRIVLVVRDAYWLQVTWDITRRAVERARAAMAEHWHHAQPILRVLRLDDSGTTSAAETIERDITVHGGVRNWYIDLNGTPGRFRVMIGYLSGTRFHMLAKSNIVRTPTPGTDATEDHWSEIARDAERIFALSGGYDSEQETTELQEVFEDRLKRSMGGPQLAQYGSGAETAFRGRGGFHFDMEVELYVYGSTVPDGFVTLNNEPVKLRSDGTFSLRLPFPDRRQVLPAVACSRDGVQQRTVVIAVERNTKVMEPFSKEQDDQS